MLLKGAQALWTATLNYIDAYGEMTGEGNSGEFHNAREAKKIEKAHDAARSQLQKSFHEATGWWPEWDYFPGEWTGRVIQEPYVPVKEKEQ